MDMTLFFPGLSLTHPSTITGSMNIAVASCPSRFASESMPETPPLEFTKAVVSFVSCEEFLCMETVLG